MPSGVAYENASGPSESVIEGPLQPMKRFFDAGQAADQVGVDMQIGIQQLIVARLGRRGLPDFLHDAFDPVQFRAHELVHRLDPASRAVYLGTSNGCVE